MPKRNDHQDWLKSATSKNKSSWYHGKDSPAFWHLQPRKKRKKGAQGYGDKRIGIVMIVSGLLILSLPIFIIFFSKTEIPLRKSLISFATVFAVASVFFWLAYQHFKNS